MSGEQSTTTKMPIEDQRSVLDMFIEQTLRMMVLSGALVAAAEQEHKWWCIQYEGGDPQLVPHECAMMLADGFQLGIKHYHAYQKELREIGQIMAEDAVEQGAGE